MTTLQKRLLSPVSSLSPRAAMNPKYLSSLLGVLAFVVILIISLSSVSVPDTSLRAQNVKTSAVGDFPPSDEEWDGVAYNQTSNVEFNGIRNSEWCLAPKYPKLPLTKCRFEDFMFRFPMNGGLTNALNFALKGAIWAYEEDVCFFIDERGPNPAQMAMRDPPLENIDPFYERYFEPMSMPRDHKKVQWALRWHKFVEPDYYQINYHEFGKLSGGLRPVDDPIRHKRRDIQSLFLYDKDNIWLKKYMLRRLFRILPNMKEIACSRLVNHGLDEEYIALSVRRGDKELEVELVSSLQPYIDEVETAVNKHFGGKVPKIFVASDDCSVMADIRTARPDWEFVGECDNASEQNGFILTGARKWTVEQTDRHVEKFVTEMIAMASAKHFIGVSTTNVSFWIYFMRHFDANDDTYVFVDSHLYPY